MTNTKNLILQLKKIYADRGLSINTVKAMVDAKEQYPPSRSSIQRIFAEGSEDDAASFSYEKTLIPVANALLDIDNIKGAENDDIQGMKALLKYLERQVELSDTAIDEQKISFYEQLEKEREQFRRSLDFLKNQIELKDKRIDQLMSDNSAFTNHIMNCPYRDN